MPKNHPTSSDATTATPAPTHVTASLASLATIADFSQSIEKLMNHAYQQSQVEGDHKSHWIDWHTHLTNLWLKVRKYA